MKILLSVISLAWLLSGVVLFGVAVVYPDVALHMMHGPGADGSQTPVPWWTFSAWLPWLAGALWVLVFLIPSLGLAALAVVLDKLEHRGVTPPPDAPGRERGEPARKRPAAEKVEPTIGEL